METERVESADGDVDRVVKNSPVKIVTNLCKTPPPFSNDDEKMSDEIQNQLNSSSPQQNGYHDANLPEKPSSSLSSNENLANFAPSASKKLHQETQEQQQNAEIPTSAKIDEVPMEVAAETNQEIPPQSTTFVDEETKAINTEMQTTPTKAAATPVLSPVSPPPASSRSVSDLIHHVKWINWHGTKTPIVTQNENGPCPLLAIMNVLLLRGQVNLPDELEIVTAQNLMERLGDCILRLTPSEFAHRPDYQQNISDAVAVLPKLMTGLDVNVRFTGVSEFEYTPECIVFDLLNIPLYHGWLIDPAQEVSKVVNSLSYNQLVEKIIDYKSGGDSAKISEALSAEQYLENSASQLTYYGLYQLNDRMKDGELAVFFRNNHFSTLIKNETGLYLLVTDQGFLNEKSVVWETLNNIEGDSKFVDAEFSLVPPKKEPLAPLPANASPQEQMDHDLMVAMSLDDQQRTDAPPADVVEEYDRQLALQLQAEEERAVSQEAASGASTDQRPGAASSPTGSSGSGGKKKDKCVII